MASLRIPPDARDALVSLANLPEREMSSLKRALKGAEPTLAIRKLIRSVATSVGLPEKEVRGLVMVLASLYATRVEKSARLDSFSLELLEALQAADKGEKSPELSGDTASKFRRDIEELLSFDESLGVTARAARIMTELQHVWQSARILTDLRPVFGPEVNELPKAEVLIHNLRITYRKGNNSKEFFVGLDSNDLRELKEVVERALKKESTLRSRAERAGTRCLVVEPE